MRTVTVVLLLFVVCGCGGNNDEPRPFVVRADHDFWSDKFTGQHVIWHEGGRVGMFDTYQEARDECDKLNGISHDEPTGGE